MTKIITKLPVDADEFKKFRELALKKMIDDAAKVIEESFSAICAEFTNRFNSGEWIYMKDKDVYYINDIVGLMPNLASRNFYYQGGSSIYNTNDLKSRLAFSGFDGDFPTEKEVKKCFNDRLTYFRRNGNHNILFGKSDIWCNGVTFKVNNSYHYLFIYDNNEKYRTSPHGSWKSDNMVTIPIYRFNGEDSKPATAAAAIFFWLQYDLTPQNFKTNETEKIYKTLKSIYAKYRIYLTAAGEQVVFDRDKIFEAILTAGAEFDFLPNAKKFLESTEANATQEYIDALRNDLLNCDKIRAELDPYDENILVDPNRGHWDLWDYGAGIEKAGEITLPDVMTARDPADDVNHGIVAIDFGTKSTVVVYENDRLQILLLQVGAGKYG